MIKNRPRTRRLIVFLVFFAVWLGIGWWLLKTLLTTPLPIPSEDEKPFEFIPSADE